MYLTKNNRSPNYQYIYFKNGKRTSITTGQTKKSEALKFISEFKEKIKNGNIPKDTHLVDFKNEYCELIEATKSKSYLRSIKLSFRKLIDFTGNRKIKQLDVRLLDKFFTSTSQRSKSAAALYYRTLKAAFSKAEQWEYIEFNPIKKIKTPKTDKSIPIFIKHNELDKIIRNTDKELLKILFIFAFHTGMRLGEIVNLKWQSISLSDRIIRVENTSTFTTKNQKERIIPINDFLLEQLYKIRPRIISINNSDYVFTRIKNIKLNEDFVSKYFKKAVRKSGLSDKIHFHTLRHSFASNLVQNGISLYVIKELLGHEDIKTTLIYSHLETDDLRIAVNQLNNIK